MENMKIEINEFQLVEEICDELERLGYKKDFANPYARVVVTWNHIKVYGCLDMDDNKMFDHPIYTTLEKLKKMERN